MREQIEMDLSDLTDLIWDLNTDVQIMAWGYQDLWNGVHHGGRYIDDKAQLEERLSGGRSIEDCRVYRVTDASDEPSDTHVSDIVIEHAHHDGTNRYVLRCTRQKKVGSNNVDGFRRQFSRAKALMI